MAEFQFADPEAARRAADLAKLFHDVFEVDPRGRQALAHLERVFVHGKPHVVTQGGIDAVLATFKNAAQRELLDYVHTQIDRFHNPPGERPDNGDSHG